MLLAIARHRCDFDRLAWPLRRQAELYSYWLRMKNERIPAIFDVGDVVSAYYPPRYAAATAGAAATSTAGPDRTMRPVSST